MLDPGEGCDEGDANSDDADASCHQDCAPAGCGDGVVSGDELCDEGEANLETPNALPDHLRAAQLWRWHRGRRRKRRKRQDCDTDGASDTCTASCESLDTGDAGVGGDGGLSDGGLGAGGTGPGDADGCGCTLASGTAASPLAVSLLFALVWWRRKRRPL